MFHAGPKQLERIDSSNKLSSSGRFALIEIDWHDNQTALISISVLQVISGKSFWMERG